MGYGVATPGDLDGDGGADIALSAPGASTYSGPGWVGVVYILKGPVAPATSSPSDAAYIVSGTDPGVDLFGAALSGGDANGDGFPDLFVGAPGLSDYSAHAAGIVYQFDGPLSSTIASADDASASWEGDMDYGEAGTRLDGTSDLDGDGCDDLLVGAPPDRYIDTSIHRCITA